MRLHCDKQSAFCVLAYFGFLSYGLAAEALGSWRHEFRPFRYGSEWQTKEAVVAPDAGGTVEIRPKSIGQSCLARTYSVDLDQTPVVELVVSPGNAAWRFLAAVGRKTVVVADHQSEGVIRRDLRQCLGTAGRQNLTLRLVCWGWSGHEQRILRLAKLSFLRGGVDCDAKQWSGKALERDEKLRLESQELRALHDGHPRLRYNSSQVADIRKRVEGGNRVFLPETLGKQLEDLAAAKAEAEKNPLLLTKELLQRGQNAWRMQYLRLRPPPLPENFSPLTGFNPFAEAGIAVEASWRQMYWHLTSSWVIASALTDDDAYARQGRRWALAMARWKFWMQPDFSYFDFACSYPLQNLAVCYDIGFLLMSRGERAEVREALAALAEGLYRNNLTGHGSIYNDLRGNHTAVANCGLGMAGAVLLGEHPRAACWLAQAEAKLVAAFAAHESGAAFESPSYANYGVEEWCKLADCIRNVTGRDHFTNPFLKRYGSFSLMVSDWEGRNLGYNQGGEGSYWNHWVFNLIARECRDPEVQWLANCNAGMGYGDGFWWSDSPLEAHSPVTRRTGAFFGDVGVSVWRSGWGPRPTILLFQAGAKGQHKEENMGHFTLYASGCRLLPDGLGTSTRSHNVPIINGRRQNKWLPAQTLEYVCNDIGGYARADLGKPYGRSFFRHLLYLRSGALLVVDDIYLGTEPKTTAEFNLHVAGNCQIDGATLAVDNGDVRLLGLTVALAADGDLLALPPTLSPRKKTSAVLRADYDVTTQIAVGRLGKPRLQAISFLRFGTRKMLPRAILLEPRQNADGAVVFQFGGEAWQLDWKQGDLPRFSRLGEAGKTLESISGSIVSP